MIKPMEHCQDDLMNRKIPFWGWEFCYKNVNCIDATQFQA